ncbi:MAG: PRTRC system protein E [Acidobacteria bacterium]|nr:PRTRC system protein E [Acidobacteriota bacterium]
MFIELMPLLAGRTVMITVARVDDRTLRVNVIPTKTSESENAALTTPLSYTGTPEELDRELGKQVASYVEAHQQLGSTLAQVKAEMDAAAKAAQEEAKRKAAERNKKESDSKTPTSQPADPPPAASMTLFPAPETTAAAQSSGGVSA